MRSIPACTGEPQEQPGIRPAHGVYPRVYGGTRAYIRASRAICGLSPRVRGNRLWDPDENSWKRSIPACTGEPDMKRIKSRYIQVYPRVYGGTPCPFLPFSRTQGLSPRVRGNLLVLGRDR